MAWVYGFLALVALQRLAELACARRNTARLLAEGGREHGARHYPWLVAFHAAWLAVTVLTARPEAGLSPLPLALFLALQAARGWVLVTLGRRWTTRIVVVPGLAPVRSGPYRLVRHPNYLIIAAELALVPLTVGAPWTALAFCLLHVPLLIVRIRAEDLALLEASPTDYGARASTATDTDAP